MFRFMSGVVVGVVVGVTAVALFLQRQIDLALSKL